MDTHGHPWRVYIALRSSRSSSQMFSSVFLNFECVKSYDRFFLQATFYTCSRIIVPISWWVFPSWGVPQLLSFEHFLLFYHKCLSTIKIFAQLAMDIRTVNVLKRQIVIHPNYFDLPEHLYKWGTLHKAASNKLSEGNTRRKMRNSALDRTRLKEDKPEYVMPYLTFAPQSHRTVM